jgi:hypothetical protein
MWLRETVLIRNMSTSVQTTMTAEAHVAQRQLLREEQTLNIANSIMCRAGIRRPASSKTERNNVRVKVNLNEGDDDCGCGDDDGDDSEEEE